MRTNADLLHYSSMLQVKLESLWQGDRICLLLCSESIFELPTSVVVFPRTLTRHHQ